MFFLRHIVAGTAPGGASGEVGVGFQVVFPGKERVQAPEKVNTVFVVHGAKLIRGHQLPACFVVADRAAAGSSEAAAAGHGADGFFAQGFGDELQSGAVLTAEKQQAVAVGNQNIPLVFVQRLDLAQRLQNHAAGDFVLSHGGQLLAEIGNGANV